MSTLELVQDALATVNDPELRHPITTLGMVESVELNNQEVKLTILLTIAGCPMRDRLTNDIETAVLKVPGVSTVCLLYTSPSPRD